MTVQRVNFGSGESDSLGQGQNPALPMAISEFSQPVWDLGKWSWSSEVEKGPERRI